MKKFDLYMASSNTELMEKISKEFGKTLGLKRKEQYTALALVLLNLKVEPEVIIPRAKTSLGTTRYNPMNIGISGLRTVLNKLHENNYISQEIGNIRGGKKIRTVVRKKAELDEYLNKHHDWNEAIKVKKLINESLILKIKKPKSDVLVDYVDNDKTNAMRAEIQAYNEILSDITITIPTWNHDDDYLELNGEQVKRSFIFKNKDHDFEYGGRMYGKWCDLDKRSRERLLIDGDETIELDFKASTINTIYIHETGSSYQGGDPYNIVIDGYEVPRDIVKQAGNIMLFTNSLKGAIKSIHNQFARLNEHSSLKKDFMAVREHISMKCLCEAYLEKHKDISEYFLAGKWIGLYCQYLESERVMKIVNHFTEQGIPILTVYDSFIVDCYYEEELRDLMQV